MNTNETRTLREIITEGPQKIGRHDAVDKLAEVTDPELDAPTGGTMKTAIQKTPALRLMENIFSAAHRAATGKRVHIDAREFPQAVQGRGFRIPPHGKHAGGDYRNALTRKRQRKMTLRQAARIRAFQEQQMLPREIARLARTSVVRKRKPGFLDRMRGMARKALGR